MSVTVSPAIVSPAPIGYRVMCACYGPDLDWRSPDLYATRDEAASAAAEHDGPEDCYDPSPVTAWAEDDEPSVNMSNSNFAAVAEALEIDPVCGSADAAWMLEQITLAALLAPRDPGRLSRTYRHPGGPQVVDCGRPEGYVQSRLADLMEVVNFCLLHGRKVSWG